MKARIAGPNPLRLGAGIHWATKCAHAKDAKKGKESAVRGNVKLA